MYFILEISWTLSDYTVNYTCKNNKKIRSSKKKTLNYATIKMNTKFFC